jgi:hypothetical protein
VRQRYEKVGQSESESDWSKDEKKGEYSQDEGETDVESEVGAYDDYCSGNTMLYLFLAGPYMARGNGAQTADRQQTKMQTRNEEGRSMCDRMNLCGRSCRLVELCTINVG